MPVRNYFLQRNTAASEILRLHGEGVELHQAAIDWATAMASAKAPGRPPDGSRRAKVTELLSDCGPDGLMTRGIAAALELDTKPVVALMAKMVTYKRAFPVKVGTFMHYYPTLERAEASREYLLAQAEAVRAEYREREKKRNRRPEKTRQTPPPKKRRYDQSLVGKKKEDFSFYRTEKIPKGPAACAEVIMPPGVKVTRQATPQSLIDRFAPTEPVRGGFVDEWRAKRGEA